MFQKKNFFFKYNKIPLLNYISVSKNASLSLKDVIFTYEEMVQKFHKDIIGNCVNIPCHDELAIFYPEKMA